jgi:hypothetical protein
MQGRIVKKNFIKIEEKFSETLRNLPVGGENFHQKLNAYSIGNTGLKC